MRADASSAHDGIGGRGLRLGWRSGSRVGSRFGSRFGSRLMAILAGGLVAACGGGSGGSSTPGGATPGPVLGAPEETVSCGSSALGSVVSHIFVSPAGTDSSSCGSAVEQACQSIQTGISRCQSGGGSCAVLVRWGRYAETDSVRLAPGVDVFGSCAFGEDVPGYRTVVIGPPGKPAVLASGLGSSVQSLENVQVIAGAGAAGGGASIAMSVTGSTAFALRNVRLIAGPGGSGPAGSDAGMVVDGNPASGSAGGAACVGATNYGGYGGTGSECQNSNGGAGWSVPNIPRGSIGGGSAGGFGSNGLWCDGRAADYPNDAGPGGEGRTGACAGAAQPSTSTTGQMAADGSWSGVRGGDGPRGGSGSGGGGGGRGGYCGSDDTSYEGGSGGGGGAGGCGGAGGTGGGQGGASIALLASGSRLTTERSVLVAADGGNGGSGGDGAPGSLGGTGAAGGSGNAALYWGHWCPGAGGAGGNGGAGGGGGPGAGGNGGPSVALGQRGSAVDGGFVATYVGAGGRPGASGRSGGAGWWRSIAQEGSSFTLSTPGWVRFGASAGWHLRWIDSTQPQACDNPSFGGDPAPGIVKSCQVTDTWRTVAQEGQALTVDWPTTVRYGAGTAWYSKTVTGSITCNSTDFGGDPIYGTVKHCEIASCASGPATAALPGLAASAVDFEAVQAAAADATTPAAATAGTDGAGSAR